MTDAELNDLVAGWCEPMPTAEYAAWFPTSAKGFWRRPDGAWVGCWFATDLNAWSKVHALLEERGLETDYIRFLIGVVNPARYTYRATARQRCEALARMSGGYRIGGVDE